MILLISAPGETVEIAEEMAARDALRRIFRTDDARPLLPMGDQARNQLIQRSAKVGVPGLVNYITSAQLACSIHATWCIDFSRSVYTVQRISDIMTTFRERKIWSTHY